MNVVNTEMTSGDSIRFGLSPTTSQLLFNIHYLYKKKQFKSFFLLLNLIECEHC